MTGHISHIVRNRNFGFITVQEVKGKFFFHKDDFNGHWTDVLEDVNNFLVPVEFDVVDEKLSPKGPRAANVRRTDHPNEG